MIQGVGPYLIVRSEIMSRGLSHEIVEIQGKLDYEGAARAEVIVDLGADEVLKNRNGQAVTAAELFKHYLGRYA